MKKKVLLIHTGGTIGMVRDTESGVLKPDRFYDSLLKVIPELDQLAEIQVEIPFLFDSSDMDLGHWETLGRVIADHIPGVDGVVITHGTDTLAYTASALSYMLENLPVPVILTGAQKPLSDLRSDARSNLINAVEMAASGAREVAVVFDDKLLRGNRTTKVHTSHFDAFHSPNFPPLAEIGINIEIAWSQVRTPQGPFRFHPEMEGSIAVLKLFPGIRPQYFQPPRECRGIILIGYGAGTVPMKYGEIVHKAEEWINQGRVVVLMSETKAGPTDPRLYESGSHLLEIGVLPAWDMTFEAAVTKLIHLMGCHCDNPSVRHDFLQPIAGEMTL